jgi:hypothetical protein
MRLLVYGMQSSGATAFTLFLAQRPDCLALVDILNNYAAPRVQTDLDMVVKVTMTTAYPLAVHMERFRPDRVILLVRDPHDTYQSLRSKNYRNHSGLLDEKFLILDQVFAERARFDAVIRYEDFVARDPSVMETITGLGWPVEDGFYSYKRRHDELMGALWRHMPDLFERLELNFGNVQGKEVSERFRDKPRDPEVEKRLRALCPRALAYYREAPGGKAL